MYIYMYVYIYIYVYIVNAVYPPHGHFIGKNMSHSIFAWDFGVPYFQTKPIGVNGA